MVEDTLQRPLRDLRISVIDNCNFRCTYCMPAEIFGHRYRFMDAEDLLTFEEIQRIVRVSARLGVEKVKLTGGEPLLRPWLHQLVGSLTKIDGIRDVGLITNGYHLAKLAPHLWSSGLRRVSVSLDSLDQETFSHMTGRSHPVSRITDAIEKAAATGFDPVKINMVVQRGVNDAEVLPMIERFSDSPFIVRFIEFMDVGNKNGWQRSQTVPSAELLERIGRQYEVQPLSPNYGGEVADRYVLQPGNIEIGFISSVSQPFCRGCTRARISADGKLYTCLFSGLGTDLRTPLRDGASDDQLEALIGGIWTRRSDRYSEERSERGTSARPKVEMYQIGG